VTYFLQNNQSWFLFVIMWASLWQCNVLFFHFYSYNVADVCIFIMYLLLFIMYFICIMAGGNIKQNESVESVELLCSVYWSCVYWSWSTHLHTYSMPRAAGLAKYPSSSFPLDFPGCNPITNVNPSLEKCDRKPSSTAAQYLCLTLASCVCVFL